VRSGPGGKNVGSGTKVVEDRQAPPPLSKKRNQFRVITEERHFFPSRKRSECFDGETLFRRGKQRRRRRGCGGELLWKGRDEQFRQSPGALAKKVLRMGVNAAEHFVTGQWHGADAASSIPEEHAASVPSKDEPFHDAVGDAADVIENLLVQSHEVLPLV
jgi:hypothetical protein